MRANTKRPLLAAACLVAGIAICAAVLAWHEWSLARALASHDLHGARAALRATETQFAREITQRGETIARNQAVTAYIGQALDNTLPGIEPDYTSVVDLLEERRTQMGLAMVAMLDGEGRVLATTDRLSGVREYGGMPAFINAKRGQRPEHGLLVDGDRATRVVVMPLASYGFSDVFLMLGEALTPTFTQTVVETSGSATGLDVLLLASDAAGTRTLVSSLPASTNGTVGTNWSTLRVSGEQGKSIQLAAGDSRLATSVPMLGSTEAYAVLLVPAGGDAQVRDAARWPVLAGVVLALLSLALAIWWVMRRIFAPLDEVLRVAEYAADTGDLHLRMPEIGIPQMKRLAAAFNRICVRASISARD